MKGVGEGETGEETLPLSKLGKEERGEGRRVRGDKRERKIHFNQFSFIEILEGRGELRGGGEEGEMEIYF